MIYLNTVLQTQYIDYIKQHSIESSSNLNNNRFIWNEIMTRNFYLGNKTIKAIADSSRNKVDKLVITKGSNIETINTYKTDTLMF